jgi:nucleoside-diphosphate-sugar epimerase
VRSVLYVSPHERDEESLAENVIACAEGASARLVFVGVHADGSNAFVRWTRRMMFGALLPHYRPKLRLSERVRRSAARPVVLCATNFFQNDELFIESIASGSLVTPISPGGLNRVDVRDIGDAAARAMLDDTLPDGAYPVVGPRSLSGVECAEILSRAWGRTVRYVGEDFTHFEREAPRVVSGRKLDDIVASYRALGRISLPTDPREVAATERLLGRPPRTYEAYVRETYARLTAPGGRFAQSPSSVSTSARPSPIS